MFATGDYMVYGTNGVCRVDSVCPSPFDKKDTRLYYVLKPLRGNGEALIYTPVDNDKVLMRPLVGRETAEALFEKIPDIPCLLVEPEKARREIYRSAMGSGELEAYVALIKTVYQRRSDLQGTQRRLPDFETEYDLAARRHLYTELSVALDLPFEGMEAYIANRVEKLAASQ